MPTILDRPQPLAKPRSPHQQYLIRVSDRQLIELPPRLIDSNRRQRVLVYVHSDHDHCHRLQQQKGRPASGQASLEAAARLLSGHARRSREGGGDTTLTSRPQPTVRNGVSRRRPESLKQIGRHRRKTMTVSARMSPDCESFVALGRRLSSAAESSASVLERAAPSL